MATKLEKSFDVEEAMNGLLHHLAALHAMLVPIQRLAVCARLVQ